jgi:hypothetical protein
MITPAFLDSQIAIELPAREMLANWNINIAVPIIIQNNINVQVCGIGIGNTATCSSGQWNLGNIWINY